MPGDGAEGLMPLHPLNGCCSPNGASGKGSRTFGTHLQQAIDKTPSSQATTPGDSSGVTPADSASAGSTVRAGDATPVGDNNGPEVAATSDSSAAASPAGPGTPDSSEDQLELVDATRLSSESVVETLVGDDEMDAPSTGHATIVKEDDATDDKAPLNTESEPVDAAVTPASNSSTAAEAGAPGAPLSTAPVDELEPTMAVGEERVTDDAGRVTLDASADRETQPLFDGELAAAGENKSLPVSTDLVEQRELPTASAVRAEHADRGERAHPEGARSFGDVLVVQQARTATKQQAAVADASRPTDSVAIAAATPASGVRVDLLQEGRPGARAAGAVALPSSAGSVSSDGMPTLDEAERPGTPGDARAAVQPSGVATDVAVSTGEDGDSLVTVATLRRESAAAAPPGTVQSSIAQSGDAAGKSRVDPLAFMTSSRSGRASVDGLMAESSADARSTPSAVTSASAPAFGARLESLLPMSIAPRSIPLEAGTTVPGAAQGSNGAGAAELADGVRWTISEGRGLAWLNVSPAGLGPVSIRVSVESEQVTVAIAASHPAARDALESLVPRLREQLLADGHAEVHVDISNGGDYRQEASADDRGDARSGTGHAMDGTDDKGSSSASGDTANTFRGPGVQTSDRALIDAWA